VANVYGLSLPQTLYSELIADPVEQALRLDATCVVANLFELPGQPELARQCIANICALKPACERYGMPLMIEPLVMRPNERGGKYLVDGDLAKILPLVRQAVELGADVVKADPCDELDEYHRVVEIAGGVPVLVRGGGRASDDEILERTAAVMRQGAAGIVYGRNVVQHPNPSGMVAALMAIVHDNAAPGEAAHHLKGAHA
jgi:DhnA family fructose-bisphosphate aldolase class Ia